MNFYFTFKILGFLINLFYSFCNIAKFISIFLFHILFSINKKIFREVEISILDISGFIVDH